MAILLCLVFLWGYKHDALVSFWDDLWKEAPPEPQQASEPPPVASRTAEKRKDKPGRNQKLQGSTPKASGTNPGNPYQSFSSYVSSLEKTAGPKSATAEETKQKRAKRNLYFETLSKQMKEMRKQDPAEIEGSPYADLYREQRDRRRKPEESQDELAPQDEPAEIDDLEVEREVVLGEIEDRLRELDEIDRGNEAAVEEALGEIIDQLEILEDQP